MTTQNSGTPAEGVSSYTDTLATLESSGDYTAKNQLGYLGKYQFGGMALQDTGFQDANGNWTGKGGINSPEDFLNNPAVQEAAQTELMALQDNYLESNGAKQYIGTEFQGVPVTKDGLRAAAHLVGAEGVKNMLETGKVPSDANGTSALEYMKQASGVDNSSSIGEKKQAQLNARLEIKQDELTQNSQAKQYELAGLSQDEQQILNMGVDAYMNSGDYLTMGDRVNQFYDLEAKKQSIDSKIAEENNRVIFDDLDNPLAYAANASLSFIDTTAKILGGFGQLPQGLTEIVVNSSVSEEEKGLFKSIREKQETDTPLTKEESKFQKSAKYPLLMFQIGADSLGNAAEAYADGLNGFVNKELTDDFVAEGSKLFKDVSEGKLDVTDFIAGSTELLLSNPSTLSQATVESIPYILSSAYSLPATVASSWSTNYSDAMNTYTAANDGEIPEGEDYANLIALSGAQALVDHLGDRIVGGKALPNLLAGSTASRSLVRTGVDIVEGAAGEFVAEGGATILGQLAGTAGKGDVDYAQAYGAGLLGAGAGGLTSGGIGAINTGVNVAGSVDPETVDKVKQAGSTVKDSVGKAMDAAKDGANSVRENVGGSKNDAETNAPTTAAEAPKSKLSESLEKAFAAEDANKKGAAQRKESAMTKYKAMREEITALRTQKQAGEDYDSARLNELGKEFLPAFNVVKERSAANALKKANNLATATTNNTNTDAAIKEVLGSIDMGSTNIPGNLVQDIIGNSNLNISSEQKTKLENYVQVAKTLEGVGKEIREGGKGFIGVNEYLNRAAQAIALGDTVGAQETLNAVQKWATLQTKKAESGMHNGKRMAPRLHNQVKAEADVLNAAAFKISEDIHSAGLDQTVTTSDEPVIDTTGLDTAPIETKETSETLPQPNVSEASAEDTRGEDNVSEDSLVEAQENPSEETTQQTDEQVEGKPLEEVLPKTSPYKDQAELDTVKEVLTKIGEMRDQGVSETDTIAQLETEYNSEIMSKVKAARGEENTVENLATRITTPEGDQKVPTMPEEIKGDVKAKREFFNSFNWVKAFFNSRKGKGNILQRIDNLFSTDVSTTLSNFINRDLTEEESKVVDSMVKLHPRFVKAFNTVYERSKGTKGKPLHQDPQLYLHELNEDNIRDTMYVAIYNWIATGASGTVYNDSREINNILGLDSRSPTPMEAYKVLGKVGTGYTSFYESLGPEILKALNITTTKDAPAHLKSKMENSLGMMAIAVMREMRVIENHQIDTSELARLNPKGNWDASSIVNFYRVRTQTIDGNEVPFGSARFIAEQMKEANKSVSKTADRLFTKAFGLEPVVKIPSFSGPAKAPRTVSKRDQKITKKEREIIEKQNARKHHIRDGAYTTFTTLDREAQQRMLGYKELETVHLVNRDAQESINNSIIRNLDNLQSFVNMRDASGEPNFYFSHVKWSNGRYGIQENFVNPQNIKAHRAFIAQEGWSTTLDPNDSNEWFWAAMAEPLGTHNKNELMDTYAQAIYAINNINEVGEASAKNTQIIEDAVEKAGAGAESFHALTELAKYYKAINDGLMFETDMAIEVDGKTNGVIIGMLQYADGETAQELLKKLGKGGIYANSYTSFNDFASNKTNLDAYNEIAIDWMKAVDELGKTNDVSPESLVAIKYIFGLITDVQNTEDGLQYKSNAKGERNLAKNPLMVSNYGAGDSSIQAALGRDFIDRIYSLIESGDQLQYDRVRYMVNKIVPNSLPKSTTPLETRISPANEAKLKQIIESSIGETVTDVINEKYKITKEGAKAVNGVLDNMYRFHDAVREDLIAKAKAKAIEEGRGVKGIVTITEAEMQAIDKAIKPLRPQVSTYYSKGSLGNDYNMAIEGDSVHGKGEGYEYEIRTYNKNSKGMSHIGYANTTKKSSPGVAGGPLTIHSLDALIMSKMYEGDIDVLGVHDAIIVGLDKAETASKNINQAMFDSMRAMNVPGEVLKSYAESYRTFQAYLSQSNVDSDALMKQVYKGLKNPKETIMQRSNDLQNTVSRVNDIKNEVLNTPDLIVHQYADELGLGAVTINPTTTDDASAETIGKRAGKDSLGSANVDDSINPLEFEDPIEVDATNVEEVFMQLPNTGGKVETDVHRHFLQERINEFGSLIMEPFKLHMRHKEGVDNYGVMSEGDIYLTNLTEGSQVSSSMLARGIRMSPEEIMAHELNHLVYLEGLQRDSQARRVVERMFDSARDSLDYKVLLPNNNPTQVEVDAAKATFDHMFYEKNGNSLAEFAAFGTTNAKFIQALNTVSTKPNKIIGKTVSDTLRNIMKFLTDLFSNQIFNLKNLRQDQKLVKMLNAMHKVNAKKVNAIYQAAETAGAIYSKAVQLPVELVRQSAVKVLTSDAVLNNKFKVISGPAQFIRASQNQKSRDIMGEGFTSIRDAMVGTRRGLIVSLFDEVVGRTKSNAATRDLARKANVRVDRQRKQVKTAMTQNIENAFKTKVTDDEWVSLSKVFLNNDVETLLPFGFETIKELMDSPQALGQAIKRYELQLAGNPNGNFYMRQARNLGYFMNTGKSNEVLGLTNAYQIAHGFGDPSVNVSEQAANQVIPIIDALATLHGLKQVDPKHLSEAFDVLSREFAEDKQNNGVSAILLAHAGLKQEAKAQFNSDKEYNAFMIKGWTKETYVSGADLQVGTSRDEAELLAQGYKKTFEIENDPSDPVQDKRFLFFAPEGAISPYMSTIASLTSNVAKGSGRVDVNRVWGATDPATSASIDIDVINAKKRKEINGMHKSAATPATNYATNYMMPVFNPDGEIVDWRYMMSEENKDTFLEKENHAGLILGSMAGNIVDKVESRKINEELVDLMVDYYNKESSTRANAYVKIGIESAEPEYREIWMQLPQEMRMYAEKKFGGKFMMARADLVTSMFGYRKYSLKNLFSANPATQKGWQKLIAGALTKIIGPNAALRVAQAENVVQALVQYTKDLVIVRSGVITVANILSNTMLLAMNGVSPLKAISYQYEAYQNSSELVSELAKVKNLQADLLSKNLSTAGKARIEGEINRLQKRIGQNPTYLAYSVGLMPTIVEDVAADSEFNNSYLGKAQKWASEKIDDKLSFAPSFVKDLTKFTVGTPDSEVYKFLNNLVMQSDFMGRYAILKHWMDKEGVDENHPKFANLVGEAEELFINFDSPTHRSIQYLNDVGIAWFTKYVARINRSIARTFAKNPTAAAAAVIGMELSSMENLIDNPAASSVFGGGNVLRVLGDPFHKAMEATDLSMGANILGL